MSSSPRATQAGTSIIAALVFAAVLGAIALSLNALQSGSSNTAALPAQAAAASQATSAQAQQPYCNQAIAQAIKNGTGNSGPVTKTYPLPSGTSANQVASQVDKAACIGATLSPGKTAPGVAADYQCVWDTGTLTVAVNSDNSSSVTLNAKPLQGATTGQCKLQICPAGGGACAAAAPFGTGANSTGPGSATAPAPGVTPDTGAQVSCTTPGANQATCTPTGTGTATSCSGGLILLNGQCIDKQSAADACSTGDVNACTAVGVTCPAGQTVNSIGSCVANPSVPPAPPQTGPCMTASGQAGTSVVGGGCTPTVVPPPQTCPAGMTCTTAGQKTNNSNSNPLSSLLSGLAKGLTSSAAQQQQAQQQAPYGTGTDGSACPAPPQPPQCATGATPQPISATGNGCMTGYQCVPTAGSTIGQTPTPQISCSPQVADVGQSVAIAYSCTNATGSSGGGFSTNNQTSGSASATIAAPPTGTNTANFGITCTGSGQTASAQCSVQVNQPAIDLVADPQAVPAGQTSTIGWITAGMKSCIISSPDDATFTAGNAASTNINGTAPTDAITQDTHFTLTCTTLGGQTKTASTIVSVGAAPTNASVNVSSTADATTVNHGDTVTITWAASSTPAGSAIALWLIDINTEEATALIAGAQSANGTYQWQLPAAGSTCDQTSLAPCASDLVAGSSYGIEAAVYTPQNAYLGVTVPSGQVAPSYVGEGYTATPFTVGQ